MWEVKGISNYEYSLTSKVLRKLVKRCYPGFIGMDGVGVALRYDEEEFIQLLA